MYSILVMVHVFALFGFLMAHGVSAGAFFALRRQRNPEAIRALLELSRSSFGITYASVLILLVTGVINGFIGNWWSRGWIWLSLILLIALIVVMGSWGTRQLNEIRQRVGLPPTYGKVEKMESIKADELDARLNQLQPMRLAAIGFGVLCVIAWLMIYKPF